jgi:hypothetical protein
MANDPTELLRPGDKVSKSGIYRVYHHRNHVQPHEVTAIYGETLPKCNGCRGQVRFILLRPAQHVRPIHFHKVTMPGHGPEIA